MRRAPHAITSAAAQLEQVCSLAARDVDDATMGRIRELIDVTSQRSELDPQWCVIGMIGGTGAGKSSLVNALGGGEVVAAGVLRPTTNEARAVLPRGRAPRELLGWLGVSQQVEAPEALPGDTVVIDMPDIDSIREEHAQVSDHLAARVDALVVVVDPQKYADARLHDEWLARLRLSHASVTVALTHIDTLDATSRDVIQRDLRRILDARGLAGARIVPVSATSGEGIDALAKHLAREAARVSREAARAQASLREAAAILRDALGLTGRVRGVETDGLAGGLARAAADLAGASVISEAVAASTLRRLHLDAESRSDDGNTPTLPTRSASDEATFVNAVRRGIGQRSQGRPARWRSLLVDRALEGARAVPAAAHREVSQHVQVSTGAPSASRVLGWVQLLAWVACILSVTWIALVHLGRAALIDAQVPAFGRIPVPTALALVSFLFTFVCAGVNRSLCRWVASRRRRAIMTDLEALCRCEVERLVIGPVRTEDNRQVTIASFIARLSL